ncbi:F-box-like domain superfamily [Sesbania bispinosa]|nr:F-box-like domain superfamily [Sesbania bispinosa]
MGKVSPKEKSWKVTKGRRQLRSSRNKKTQGNEDKVLDKSPLMLSPVNLVKQTSLLGTPKTPKIEDCQSDSRLESLPMDLLVKILCHLHHDQLKAVFHVSTRIRKAVIIARQFYFNYTTPDRSRQEMLSTMTPRPTDHWPFLCKGDGKGGRIPSPHTPKAPRHGPRPPSRLKVSEMRQVAAVLFQESAFSARCLVPSVIPKPLCKSLASNRVFSSMKMNCARQLLRINFFEVILFNGLILAGVDISRVYIDVEGWLWLWK